MKFLPKVRTSIGAIGLSLMASVAWGQKTKVDGIVAVVGRDIILKSDWDLQVDALKGQLPGGASPDPCRVLEEMLFEKLLVHQAEIDSVAVTEDEVEETMNRRIDVLIQQIGSARKLEEYYKKSIVEIKEEMRELVSNQMIAQKMQSKIAGDIAVTPTEVYELYKTFPEDSLPLINSEVEWAQIVLYPKVKAESKQEAIQRLEELRQRVAKGSNFATLAILYSEDPGSAKNGGEYRGIKRGQFVKEFEAVAFNLGKGEVSEPFETEFGFHIVQLLEKKGEELDLRHILIKPKISDDDLNRTRATLDSLKGQIALGSLSFEQASAQFSEDENTRYNNGLMMNPQTGDSKWELNQLDRSVFYTLEALKPGEISKASLLRNPDGKEGFRIIKVLSRTQPHRANLKDDYARLQNVAENKKRAEAIDEWIEARLLETSVRIQSDWVSCRFKNSWTNTPTPTQP